MRHIEEKMIEFLDEALRKNGFAQIAIQMKNPRALLVEAAKVCVGVREKTGKNDGPLVELFQETIGKANGEAWCMSFVQTLIAYVEVKLNVTSPVFASEHCLTVWNKTPKSSRVVHYPNPGAIAIWRHGSTTNGHTGVVVKWGRESSFDAIEGNTTSGLNEKEEIVREGGGVYATKRAKKTVGSMQLVGFLKPF
jgi:hypothetical protein